MQDMKINSSAALIDQSMSPYHAGETGWNRCVEQYLEQPVTFALLN